MKTSTFLDFNLKYLLFAAILFLVEVLIAMYAHDEIIRPYLGDVLVVILMYCFVKSFFNIPPLKTAISVLIFSFVVETLQYFHFVKLIGLERSNLANIVMGNYFAWEDLLAYTIGIFIVLIAEKRIAKVKLGKNKYTD